MPLLQGVKMSPVRDLEKFAIEKYSECPKYVTIIRHADLQDDSEFHCVLFNSLIGPILPGRSRSLQRDFLVPGQDIILAHDMLYGLFSITRVLDQDLDVGYWLIVSVHSRMGFLIPLEKLPQELQQPAEELA
jgi:hypothetical protein